MIKAVIFDLDNTLIDFMSMKKASCDAAISAMIGSGLDVKRKKAIEVLFVLYDKYGLEEKTIFQKFLKEVTGRINYRILANGIVAYRKARSGFLDPYPGTDYVLLKLKDRGIKLGILTDAPRLKAWIRLASMKLSNFFDVVVTLEDTKKEKPSKEPFKTILNKLKIKPEECLMVGDRPERDIEGAKKLGIRTCFAKYGNPEAKAKADYTIGDIRELLKIVK
ncbi:TIGR02253 family HAD-type hydrolase [Candidatus Woesearchaeota archaeon]|nr:TIGR02253 family HAD-type hydrolase [Candidatus Woesearchaeota archaeon]